MALPILPKQDIRPWHERRRGGRQRTRPILLCAPTWRMVERRGPGPGQVLEQQETIMESRPARQPRGGLQNRKGTHTLHRRIRPGGRSGNQRKIALADTPEKPGVAIADGINRRGILGGSPGRRRRASPVLTPRAWSHGGMTVDNADGHSGQRGATHGVNDERVCARSRPLALAPE